MSGIEQPAPAVTPTAALGLVDAALRRACPHPVWLSGEVEQVAGPGPNIYMTLADQQAQIRVAVIGLDAHRVKGRLVRAGVVLERGVAIRVYGHLRLYAGEGLVELRAIDIDTAVAVGSAELERRRVLEVIGRLGLAGRQQTIRQRTMGTPIAPLRVGVVTPGGQSWTDFEARLQMTPWAWDLRVLVTPSQGPRAAESIARAVRDHSGHVDLMVVTRGGGSGVTAAYDTGVVAAAICQADCPVIVAVGHHDDTPVAETVAWRREAIPTAAAVTLDRVLAAQRDDLARALTAAVDDAQRYLAAVTRRLEDTWSGFQNDLERLTAPATRPDVTVPSPTPAPRRPAPLVVGVAALMAVLVVAVIVLAVTK